MNKLICQTRERAAERELFVYQTIISMINNGDDVNFTSVAQRCGVSRHYMYRHAKLRSLIEDCRVTKMSKAELQQEVVQLRVRIRNLENLLQE